MSKLPLVLVMAITFGLSACATGGPSDDSMGAKAIRQQQMSQETILQAAEGWFGNSAAGIGSLIEKAFKENGRPTGYIAGEEAAGAVMFGLRYGHGTLHLESGDEVKVYWQGPSIGFDLGGNASKVFVLVYNLESLGDVFQRYPGVDGSAYFIGGLGMNYNQSGNVILAPIRTGLGWRLGINGGYLKVTPQAQIVPF